MESHIESLQKKLTEAFPGHTVEVSSAKVTDDFKPYLALTVDGKTLTARWSIELVEDMRTYHGIDVEQEIFNALVFEIKEELNRPLV